MPVSEPAATGDVSLLRLAASRRVKETRGCWRLRWHRPSGTDRVWRANRAAYATSNGLLPRVDRDLPPLVTFAFGHCTTVCPVIVHDLQAARRLAGRPETPLIVITLDPWRDTPERLPALMEHWELAPQDRIFSGFAPDVEQALDSLGIARRRSLTTGDVDHVTVVLILDAAGRIAWRVDGGSRGVAETLAGTPLAAAVPSAR